VLAAAGAARAFDESADGERSLPPSEEAVAWKLTTTYYATTNAPVGIDYKAWFARITWDPKVSFTPNDMVRVAVGLRF